MAWPPSAPDREAKKPLVVADLPWMSYHTTPVDTVRNAAQLIRAGAQAVKLEGGRKRLPMIEAIIDAEIPVMGHLGLTPQSVHAMGGFKVQGREHGAALELVADAKALAAAGCFAIVLEGVPDEVARMITDAVDVPTIGIGAGPGCDGQVLVYHDVLGIEDRILPKFVRRYADVKATSVAALAAYAARRAHRRLPGGHRELPPLGRRGRDPRPLRDGRVGATRRRRRGSMASVIFDERRARQMLWVACAVVGLGVYAFVLRGADQPADPYLTPPTASCRPERHLRVTRRGCRWRGSTRSPSLSRRPVVASSSRGACSSPSSPSSGAAVS